MFILNKDMQVIFIVTKGEVTPMDFYDLPKIIQEIWVDHQALLVQNGLMTISQHYME